jgi:hypothetical protein
LASVGDQAPAVGAEGICLYKTRGFMRAYEQFLRAHQDFQPKRILELGVWGGGSIALWNEVFRPDHLVGLDIMAAPADDPLAAYVRQSAAGDRIRVHWNSRQEDQDLLGRIVAVDFGGVAPDLVIDDASHAYLPTKRSLECLFPLMAAGSMYVIEDWAADLKVEPGGGESGGGRRPLSQLMLDIVSTFGRGGGPIGAINVYHGIVAIERNHHQCAPGEFSIDPGSAETQGGPTRASAAERIARSALRTGRQWFGSR